MLFLTGKHNVDGNELGSVMSVSMHSDVYYLRIGYPRTVLQSWRHEETFSCVWVSNPGPASENQFTCLFVFGAKAPSGPGPPHSRGF